MAKILCRTANMPEDERMDLYELFQQHEIDFYETQAGFWGVGVAALWIRNKADYDSATQLFDDYQQQRSQNEEKSPSTSIVGGLYRGFLQKPLLFLLTTMIVFGVLFISLYPFMNI